MALIEHPEQAERLAAEPALTATAVEELLRFTTPVPCGTARTLLDDVSIEGTDDAQGVQGDGDDHFGQPGRGGVRPSPTSSTSAGTPTAT